MADDVAAAGLVPADAAASTAAFQVVRDCGRHGFPFGMPVSVERERHLTVLTSRAYWASPKVSGTRVALILAPPQCAIILDRARAAFGIAIQAPSVLFKGTVLDAELVKSKACGGDGDHHQPWHLLVFDIAMAGGVPITDPLSRRLSLIQTLCSKISCATICIEPKPMAPLATNILHLLPTLLPHFECDGVIFTPESDGPPRPGIAHSVLKMKPSHTLDVLWTDGGGPQGELWFGDAADMVSVNTLRPSVVLEGFPNYLPSTPVVIEVAIVDVNAETLKLQFVGKRPKKPEPNNALCVLRTLVSAQDNVRLEDIVQALEDASTQEA